MAGGALLMVLRLEEWDVGRLETGGRVCRLLVQFWSRKDGRYVSTAYRKTFKEME